MSAKLTFVFVLMVLVASVNAFWRYLKVLWYVASSIVRQANEQGVTDTGLGENQELPPRFKPTLGGYHGFSASSQQTERCGKSRRSDGDEGSRY